MEIPGELAVETDPTPEQVQFLEDRLYDHNIEQTGFADGLGLALFVRDDEGGIRTGLCGHTWGGCCEIKQVWVHPALRGRGLGRRMLEAAEAEARRRGARQIVLSTHSFQAPGLYRKLGFEQVARIEGYPQGHASLWFRKVLEEPG